MHFRHFLLKLLCSNLNSNNTKNFIFSHWSNSQKSHDWLKARIFFVQHRKYPQFGSRHSNFAWFPIKLHHFAKIRSNNSEEIFFLLVIVVTVADFPFSFIILEIRFYLAACEFFISCCQNRHNLDCIKIYYYYRHCCLFWLRGIFCVKGNYMGFFIHENRKMQ